MRCTSTLAEPTHIRGGSWRQTWRSWASQTCSPRSTCCSARASSSHSQARRCEPGVQPTWVRRSSKAQPCTVQVQGDGILKDGPFGYLRNPLYLGTFLHTLALALLMPRSGAIFSVVLIGVLQIRLILGEEAFLTQKLGQPYTAYCTMVPRLFPALRRRVAAAGLRPRWGQAALAEIYFWGVAASLAVAGWKYNANLLIRCVVVSVGISILARAFTGKPAS